MLGLFNHRTMIIAVDFDGTLACRKGGKLVPNIGLINWLINMQMSGNAVILNTCRTGESLREAVVFCSKYGLGLNAVNENLPQSISMLGYNPRKIYADVYIDDKALKPFMPSGE